MNKNENKTKVRHYKQKVREVWLQNPDFKQWARKIPGDDTKVYCNNCKCSLIAKLHDLRQHVKTEKHLRATKKRFNEEEDEDAASLLKTEQAESDTSSHHEQMKNDENEEMVLNEAEGIFEIVNTKRTKNCNANRHSMNPLHRDLSTSSRINDSITSLYDEESEIFARAWALSFRRLSEDQKLYAKRCIDEIMVLGRLNALELDTVYALRKK